MNKSPRPYPITDRGASPLVVNLPAATERNTAFRRALFTGEHLQLTVMSVPAGEEIGIEVHPDTDQMLRIESGNALLRMGNSADTLRDEKRLGPGAVILIPAGTYHNLINLSRTPLGISSVYAPPHHPQGTVHPTRADAEAAEKPHAP